MTRPPTAVLVLLSCVISMSPWLRHAVVTGSWVGNTESPFADRMALFNHVLLNDARWSPVLKQRVKLPVVSLPRYRMAESYKEVLNRVQLVDPYDKEDHTVMHVLQQLMEKTPWSGTNVNFTAYALSTGVTCFTYNNVSFVLSLIVNRIGMLARKMKESDEKNDDGKDKKKVDEDGNNSGSEDGNNSGSEDGETSGSEDGNNSGSENGEPSGKASDRVDEALDDVRMMLAVLMDTVAAVEGDLAFFATALYDYDGAENTNNELILLRILEMIKEEVDSRLQWHCHPVPHTEIYRYLGEYETLNDSPPPPDKLLPDDETLERELAEFEDIIDSMIDVYDGLDVETMPMETWLQILDYRLPISMDIKFYIESMLKVPTKPEETWSDRLKEASKKKKKKKKKKPKKKKKGKRKK